VVQNEAVYGAQLTSGVVYAQGLYCDSPNFTQTGCAVVNLTADVVRPVFNATTGVPLPDGPLPVILGIHGGSYSHGSSLNERDNVEYFVRRGWVGVSINYRLCNGGYGQSEAALKGQSEAALKGNLVCQRYGSFPTHEPFGNASCDSADVKNFGLNTDDGCPLSAPPKHGSFFGTLLSWTYPAMRDAKAAVRWLRANAAPLGLSSDHITAVGGSAGACSVVGLATTFEDDYKLELGTEEDPTLASTHLSESSRIATGLVKWGGDYVPVFAQLRDPENRSRLTVANSPLATYHGSADGVIGLAQEDVLKNAYAENGVVYEQHVLEGAGHGADDAPVVTPAGNQSQYDNMFEFVVRTQGLHVMGTETLV